VGQFKPGVDMNDVYLFSLMVKIGRNSYFESWLNYHAEGGIGKDFFEGLASHLYIPVVFLDEGTDIAAAYEVKNSVRYGFKDYLKFLQTSSLGRWLSLMERRLLP